MKIALAQVNSILGNFEVNADLIVAATKQAHSQGAQLVVFPEATLFGYSPCDLLERTAVAIPQMKAFSRLQKKLPNGIAIAIGLFTKNKAKTGRAFFNSAAILQKGKKPKIFHKQLLPVGDVFDEGRFIEPGVLQDNYFRLAGKKIFVTICEDIWGWPNKQGRSHYAVNPLVGAAKKHKDVDLVINLSASPYYPNKSRRRQELVKNVAQVFRSPVVYVNMVGAQDEVIFDGGSFASDAKGNVIVQAKHFVEDLVLFDTNEKDKRLHPQQVKKIQEGEELRQALVLGIRDFCRKINFKKIHVGLSGGVDSSVAVCLATEALGADRVSGILMPGPFSDPNSLKWAKELADAIGIHHQEIPITKLYETFKSLVDSQFSIKSFNVVHENLQARIRGMLLMAFANQNNSLLLATGNKDELAAGYCTLYGDMCGGLMPLGDLTKGQVYAVAAEYNRDKEVIPLEVIKRPPSAELRSNQKDQDSLPPYDELDRAVRNIIELEEEAKSETEKWLLGALFRSEFKRWQAPPILRVSQHAFGRGRRVPIAHQWRE